MPPFDIVSEVNQVEVRNALDQTNKEVSTRFDFKGSDARVEHAEKTLTIYADDDFKLKQVMDVFTGKCAKRGVDVRFLDLTAKIEKAGGDKVRQPVAVTTGIDSDNARKIQTLVKQSKLKVQAAIQGDAVRVTGAKRDDLQTAMAVIRKEMTDLPLSFDNFRD